MNLEFMAGFGSPPQRKLLKDLKGGSCMYDIGQETFNARRTGLAAFLFVYIFFCVRDTAATSV